MKAIFQLFVRDIKAAKKWYKEMLRARVLKDYPKWKCALISIGGTQIDMGEPCAGWGLNWKVAKKLVGRQIGILIDCCDVEGEYKRLRKNGVKFLFKPRRAPWGETIADFRDMDGNRLRLVSK